MLGVPLKKGFPLEIAEPIQQYIASTLTVEDAEESADELNEMQRMRDVVVGAKLALEDQKAVLQKYYRACSAIESRFPISKDKEHLQLKFQWSDALRPAHVHTQCNMSFEKAAIVVNLASVSSQLALQLDRRSDQGVKQACQLFQEASGCFALVRDKLAERCDVPKPLDLSKEVLTFFDRVMLAQAQECIFEKASRDATTSPNLLARLALATRLLYREALDELDKLPDASHLDRAWTQYTKSKMHMFEIHTELSLNKEHAAAHDMASQLPRLEAAAAAGKRLLSAVRDSTATGIVAAAEALELTAREQLAEAHRENKMVYFINPNPYDELPTIQPVLMVQPIDPSSILEAAPPDQVYFRHMVPESHTKELSKYTDQVDTLVRSQLERLEVATDEARVRLAEWELPGLLDALLRPDAASVLPDALRTGIEAWEARGGLAGLERQLVQLRAFRDQVEGNVRRCSDLLDEEEAQDAAQRQQAGGQSTRQPSAVVNRAWREQIAQYRSTLAAAAASDETLLGKMASSRPLFASLTLEGAVAQMPRLAMPLVHTGDTDPQQLVVHVKSKLSQLNALASERAELEEELKARRHADDILPKLLALGTAPADALVARELAKYNDIIQRIQDHVEKNRAVLQQVGVAQQEFRDVFQHVLWRSAVDAQSATLRVALESGRELQADVEGGVSFYKTLQERLSMLVQSTEDYCRSRKADAINAAMQRMHVSPPAVYAASSAPPPPPSAPSSYQAYQGYSSPMHPPPPTVAPYPPPPPPPPPSNNPYFHSRS